MKVTTDFWNATLYDERHSFVFIFGEYLIALLDPKPGERILDLGCGTGHLTKKIAESGAIVIGLDNSPNMIESAREAYPDLEFVLGDATDFAFVEPFDAVFSNATLHWVKEADKAIVCISGALKPGGRFVAEFGAKGNIANITIAMQSSLRELIGANVPHEWYFPSVGEYATLLERYGLEVNSAWLFDRPTPLEGEDGMRNWFKMFGGGMLYSENLRGAAADLIEQATALAEQKLRKTNYSNGTWFADYRRIRIVASK